MSSNPPTDRRERYAAAIHDAMEPDLSLVDQEPGFQALFARAAEAAVALADAELAAVVAPPPATRADEWRAAAVFVEAMNEACDNKRPCESCTTREDVASELRRMADEAQRAEGAAPETAPDLADGPVRCPLCPSIVTLHTPNGARAHFTTVHPEQRITGRGPGPWPLLVTDGDEAQQQPDTDTPCCADLMCACVQVDAAGRCECTRRDGGPETCGRTRDADGIDGYPPCARPAGHGEAYCRSAGGRAYFLAAGARQDAPSAVPCPPGCIACATDESHDPAPAAGVGQDGAPS